MIKTYEEEHKKSRKEPLSETSGVRSLLKIWMNFILPVSVIVFIKRGCQTIGPRVAKHPVRTEGAGLGPTYQVERSGFDEFELDATTRTLHPFQQECQQDRRCNRREDEVPEKQPGRHLTCITRIP